MAIYGNIISNADLHLSIESMRTIKYRNVSHSNAQKFAQSVTKVGSNGSTSQVDPLDTSKSYAIQSISVFYTTHLGLLFGDKGRLREILEMCCISAHLFFQRVTLLSDFNYNSGFESMINISLWLHYYIKFSD